MKRSKAKYCIPALAVLLLSTGCAGKGSLSLPTSENSAVSGGNLQTELIPITNVRNSFSEDANTLKSRTFDNINFADAYFTFTQTDKVYTFDYKITDYDISPDDAYNCMRKRLDEFFPGMFSDEEKTSEIRFFNVIPNFNEKGQRTEEYPTLEQYKALEEKNYPYVLSDHPTIGLRKSNDFSLRVMNGILREYDNGDLARRSGFDREIISFNVLNEFSVVYRTENLESEKVFHLLSGDISIADAVKSAEKKLSELKLSERELPFKMRIQNVNVLDIGNDRCAFYFGIVPEYKGIKSDCILPDETVFGFSTISDNTNELDSCGELIMCESDRICRYRYLNPASVYDITKSSSTASIIPLRNAAQTVSEYLSEDMQFNVLSVLAINKSFSDFNSFQSIDPESYESYERRVITIRPCWRFVLQPLTGGTDRLYYVFVDMLTGETYNTVQSMESDIYYD